MKIRGIVRALTKVWHGHEKVRYAGVGLWNTAFAYLAFAIVYTLMHDKFHYLLISFFAHVLAVCNAFICQRSLVFQSKRFWPSDFLRFNVAQLLVAACGILGVAFLVEVIGLRPLPAQLSVMTMAVLMSYFLSKHFAFSMTMTPTIRQKQ